VWRRIPKTGELVREEARFRPWLASAGAAKELPITYRELDGPGSLRFLVSAEDGRALVSAVLEGATGRLGRRVSHLRELGKETVLALAPEEQYLAATGRTYFRDLSFDDLHECSSTWRRRV
jgi:hypothetical protein